MENLICNFILFVGVLQILYFLFLYVKSQKTKKWKSVKGEIISSRIEKDTDSSPSETTTTSYKINIEYKYIVNDVLYKSHKVYYGDSIQFSFSRRLTKIVSKYEVGKLFDVYYDPINPSKSVLLKGVNPVIYDVFILGVAFIIISIIINANYEYLHSIFT